MDELHLKVEELQQYVNVSCTDEKIKQLVAELLQLVERLRLSDRQVSTTGEPMRQFLLSIPSSQQQQACAKSTLLQQEIQSLRGESQQQNERLENQSQIIEALRDEVRAVRLSVEALRDKVRAVGLSVEALRDEVRAAQHSALRSQTAINTEYELKLRLLQQSSDATKFKFLDRHGAWREPKILATDLYDIMDMSSNAESVYKDWFGSGDERVIKEKKFTAAMAMLEQYSEDAHPTDLDGQALTMEQAIIIIRKLSTARRRKTSFTMDELKEVAVEYARKLGQIRAENNQPDFLCY